MIASRLPIFAALLCAGCTARNALPAYPDTDTKNAIRILADRASEIKSVSADGLITLSRTDGQSVRLDGALAMRPPDRVRLRAWKLGQAVFDLTLTPDGLWLITPDDPSRKEQIKSSGLGSGDMAKMWSLLAGNLFESQGLVAINEEKHVRVTQTRDDGTSIVCLVDRATLTPRRYSVIDDRGVERFTLMLDQYESDGHTVWPRKILAVSETGTIIVDLHEIEINGDVPAEAFTPPKRAEKLR